MSKVVTSAELFEALKQVIELPDNVKRLHIFCDAGEMAMVFVDQYVVTKDGSTGELSRKRFKLVERTDATD